MLNNNSGFGHGIGACPNIYFTGKSNTPSVMVLNKTVQRTGIANNEVHVFIKKDNGFMSET